MQGHYVSGLQCNVITWEQTKRNLSQRNRKHKLYNMMLTRLVRQCCKQVAGQRSKPPPLLLLNLHFPLSSAFLSPPSPKKQKTKTFHALANIMSSPDLSTHMKNKWSHCTPTSSSSAARFTGCASVSSAGGASSAFSVRTVCHFRKCILYFKCN